MMLMFGIWGIAGAGLCHIQEKGVEAHTLPDLPEFKQGYDDEA